MSARVTAQCDIPEYPRVLTPRGGTSPAFFCNADDWRRVEEALDRPHRVRALVVADLGNARRSSEGCVPANERGGALQSVKTVAQLGRAVGTEPPSIEDGDVPEAQSMPSTAGMSVTYEPCPSLAVGTGGH